MDVPDHLAACRLRRPLRDEHGPPGAPGLRELVDEHTQRVLAASLFPKHPVYADLEIRDGDDRVWRMRPNRKVAPSRWRVTDPSGDLQVEFRARHLRKLANPFHRVACVLHDASGEECFRLVDPRKGALDRTLGGGPVVWCLLAGEREAARIVRLPRWRPPAPSLLGRLKAFLRGTDAGIVSAGSDHVLPGPVLMGLLVLYRELTDVQWS